MYSCRVLYSHNNIYPPVIGVLLFENVAVRTNTGKRFSQHKNNNHSDANKKITAKKIYEGKTFFVRLKFESLLPLARFSSTTSMTTSSVSSLIFSLFSLHFRE